MKKLFNYLFLVFLLIFVFFKLRGRENIFQHKFLKKSQNIDKYVILAVQFDNPSKVYYYFYLPFVVQAWNDIGFKCIILFVSSSSNNIDTFYSNNTLIRKTIEYLRKQNALILLIKSKKNFGTITTMVCRLFVGALSELDDEDFVLTSDSDLIPVRNSYYKITNVNAINILNAYCCGTFIFRDKKYTMYPIGHIGMKKKLWRQVMNLSVETKINSQTLIEYVSSNIGPEIVKEDSKIVRGDSTWYADQTIISIKISEYVNVLKKAEIVKEKYTGIRYDRSKSDSYLLKLLKNNYKLITDFHAFHVDFIKRWKTSDELFKRLFNHDNYLFLNQYYNEFINLYLKSTNK